MLNRYRIVLSCQPCNVLGFTAKRCQELLLVHPFEAGKLLEIVIKVSYLPQRLFSIILSQHQDPPRQELRQFLAIGGEPQLVEHHVLKEIVKHSENFVLMSLEVKTGGIQG
mgnify:CR=1 FL=1